MPEPLLSRLDPEGVATLTLNRPRRHNALDPELVAALSHRLADYARDPAVRLLRLHASGPSFCSGADLADMQSLVEQGEAANLADAERLGELLHALASFPRPTLARVEGPAYGGGIGLLACCDLVLAGEGVEFAFSEVRLGLVAALIAPYVVAAIGAHQARGLMLSGEPFSARRAWQLGLVTEPLAPARLAQRERQLTTRLLAGEPSAQRLTKQLLADLAGPDPGLRRRGARLSARQRAGESARRRLRAFLEGHRPGHGHGE